MASTTTTARVRATRCSPGGWTKERELRRRREAFALRLAPVLRELRDAGLSNREVAEELTRRGVPSETGRWTSQGIAAVGRRLERLAPAPRRPRGWGRRIPREDGQA